MLGSIPDPQLDPPDDEHDAQEPRERVPEEDDFEPEIWDPPTVQALSYSQGYRSPGYEKT